jgi:hypothetical protein
MILNEHGHDIVQGSSAYFINKIEALYICSFCFIELLNDLAPLCIAFLIRGMMATSPRALPVGIYGDSSGPQLVGWRGNRILGCTRLGEGFE